MKTPLVRCATTFLFLFTILFSVVGTAGMSLWSADVSEQQNAVIDAQRAEAFNPPKYLMCDSFASEHLSDFYGAVSTDAIEFNLQSKSAITGGIDQVDGGLNSILDYTQGPSFESVNDWILHTRVDEDEEDEDEDEEHSRIRADDYEAFDGGGAAYVSPYDRFGVAGLKWTSYGGEWKYYHVEACEDNPEAVDYDLGMFYEDRLAPRSTWDDRAESADIRSQQHNIGAFNRFVYAFNNLIANSIFSVAKLAVVIVIGVSSLAFADISNVLGLNDLLVGADGGTGGIFDALYQGIFMPLVIIAFVLTACYMLWYGIVKRQYRQALVNGLLKTVAAFFLAVIVMVSPAFFVSLPNNIAVGVQSLIMSGVNTGSIGGHNMCDSQIGSFGDEDIIPGNAPGVAAGTDRQVNFLEQISVNTSSAIGCAFWQVFLLTPWSQGQFGDPWDQLYAEGFDPGRGGSSSLGNSDENAEFAGDAQVPLGAMGRDDDYDEFNDAVSIHNWAMFQLSTQTDSHFDMVADGINHDGYSNADVHNDWWRVADAVSNYYEVEGEVVLSEETLPDSVRADLDTRDDYTMVPASEGATEYWDAWVGNNGGSRILIAMQSVIFAVVGTLGVFVFSALAVVYAIGLALLMAFAPLMFLFACWAGRGQEIFKGWLELLINTMLKRIFVGVLFVMMLAITVAALNVLEDVGFFAGMFVLAVSSWALVKNRNKILDALAAVRLGGADFSSKSSQIGSKFSQAGKTGAKLGGATAMGSVMGARRSGGLLRFNDSDRTGLNKFKDMRLNKEGFKGASTGAKIGAKSTVRNAMYASDSNMVRHASMNLEQAHAREGGRSGAATRGQHEEAFCASCGANLAHAGAIMARGASSKFYCINCHDEDLPQEKDRYEMTNYYAQEHQKALAEQREADVKQKRESMHTGQGERDEKTDAEGSTSEKDEEQTSQTSQASGKRGKNDVNITAPHEFTRDDYAGYRERKQGEADRIASEQRAYLDRHVKLNPEDLENGVVPGVNPENLSAVARKSMEGFDEDVKRHKAETDSLLRQGWSVHDARSTVPLPKLPEEIEPYINKDQLYVAFYEGNYQVAAQMTADAWVQWYQSYGYGADEESTQGLRDSLMESVASSTVVDESRNFHSRALQEKLSRDLQQDVQKYMEEQDIAKYGEKDGRRVARARRRVEADRRRGRRDEKARERERLFQETLREMEDTPHEDTQRVVDDYNRQMDDEERRDTEEEDRERDQDREQEQDDRREDDQ